MPSDYARCKARKFDASSVSLAQLKRFGNFLLPVQARAITQQARSPVIRVYAASPDQTISDSAADSSLESVTSEAPSDGSSNGSGHASPQSATEGNGCAVDAWQRLSELRRLLYEQQCHLHGKKMEINRWVHAVWHTSIIMVDNVHAIFLPSHAFCWQLSLHRNYWSCRAGKAAHLQQLRLDLAAALMPHPAKAHRGGEDAVFLSDDGLTFGEHRLSCRAISDPWTMPCQLDLQGIVHLKESCWQW